MLPGLRRLTSDLHASDPTDLDGQLALKRRIERLRDELERARATDLAAYLDAACELVGQLASGIPIGPSELQGLAGALLARAELRFAGRAGEGPAARGPVGGSGGSGGSGGGSAEQLARRIDVSAMEERMLGEVMLQLGFVTRAQLEQGLVTQRATDQRIGEALVAIGAATWGQVKEAIEVQGLLRSAARPAPRLRRR